MSTGASTASSASSTNYTFIPRPDKFDNQCEITTWFKQFELFLTLSKTDAADKKMCFFLTFPSKFSRRALHL